MIVKLIDNPEDLAKAMKLRIEVFVKEQKVPAEEECDEFEDTSRHFIIKNEADLAIGTARWRYTDKGIKLERFAIKRKYRGMGWGSQLVQAVLDDIHQHPNYQGQKLYMHAQLSAIPLYEKFEFKPLGEQFEECGILHYTMEKK